MRRRILVITGMLACALTLQARSALAEDYYGAIAFSESSGADGWANDHGSRRSAEETALQNCGPRCEIVLWFKNACGALATASDHSYGTGWADSRREAEAIALNGCREHAEDCGIARWVCTTR